ncbi:conjugal transfer protein TraD [Sphingomonas qomolangmaensis]|uniref:Conjugal transfer protein TraD n=1 Tax=Sphingomonas qomolangmaensis TaxID=2918765 RepID=A0ABY5LCE7_9SPHN|nr:conjugal transfer protein TraD [Sphingomonas qomolangmaensis]UUL83781.1 conjugal transfer protein TraD [Sphingomonas qomolangmaensis]
MRKPRDYDAELKALDDKARSLKARKLEQLGELVVATGADALPIEQLAGALLIATRIDDVASKEAQRSRGAAFFQTATRNGSRARRGPGSGSPNDHEPQPPAARPGAA